jgi:quercetin dioxygenase-like cupin family protein
LRQPWLRVTVLPADDIGPCITLCSPPGTTVVGEDLNYPASGAAQVTAAIITLTPGARTQLDKHDVPMFAYILDGEITVDYGAPGIGRYRKGHALMEAMDVAHFGAEPLSILVVYVGAQGAADSVLAK